jgi:hypothetical protein
VIARTFFGTMIQAEWITDSGELAQPVTKFFGLLRLWDSRAVWHKMETDTEALEANLRAAVGRDAEVMFTFGEPPASALLAGSSKVPTMDAWQAFVRRVVTESDGRISVYDGWNEPGIPPYWDGSPELLVEYERAKYLIIKELAPNSIVLSPSFTEFAMPRGIAFIDRYLAAGGGQWCDGISAHFYVAKPEHMIGDVAALRALMRKHGVDRPIWNTEYVIGPCELSLRPAYQAQSLIIQASLGIQCAVWNPEIPGSEDYTDPTTQTVAGWLVGATVGPLERDGDTRYVKVQRPGEIDLELSWTEQSFPVFSAVRHFPATAKSSGKRGCLLFLLPFIKP